MNIGIQIGVTGTNRRFSPDSVSDLTVWLDASNPNNDGTLPTDATTLQTWKDRSRNANDYTQGTASRRATFNLDRQNGLPGLSFDGGDLYTRAQFDTLSHSLFVVYKNRRVGSNGTDQTVFSNGNAQSTGYVFVFSSVEGRRAFLRSGIDGHVGGIYTTNTELVSLIVSQPGRYKLYLNGTNEFDLASGTLNAPADVSSIGGRSPLNDAFIDADIYELLFFSRAVTDIERGLIEAYLNSKWAVY
jgi:hypothetical protein